MSDSRFSKLLLIVVLVCSAVLTTACAPAPDAAPEPTEAAGDKTTGDANSDAGEAETEASAPTDAEILPHPFTAEQIAAQMQPGLQVKVRMSGPEGASNQLWTVLQADDEGCEIEYVNLDADGGAVGEKVARPSGWVELRNHASFPAAHSTREETERETALGTRAGLLYSVDNPEAGTTTDFFFARDFAGAPLWMQTRTADGTVLVQMEQLERSDA